MCLRKKKQQEMSFIKVCKKCVTIFMTCIPVCRCPRFPDSSPGNGGHEDLHDPDLGSAPERWRLTNHGLRPGKVPVAWQPLGQGQQEADSRYDVHCARPVGKRGVHVPRCRRERHWSWQTIRANQSYCSESRLW